MLQGVNIEPHIQTGHPSNPPAPGIFSHLIKQAPRSN